MVETNPFSSATEDVFENRDVLTEEYTPDTILERDEEIDEYMHALLPAVSGSTPDNIMLYGNTGVGKTVVTDYMTDSLVEKCNGEGYHVSVFQQNCNEESAFSTCAKLINTIRGPNEKQFPTRGLSTSEAYAGLYEELHTVGADINILVLDEIDHLNNVDSLLYDLSRQATDPYDENLRLCVIGISNDYSFHNSLSPKTQSTFQEREISFAPYNADELRTILSDRAEKAFEGDVLDSGVIPYASAQAAQDSGNARQGLDLLHISGEIVMKDGRTTITEDDIDAAKWRLERGRLEDNLSTLTEHQKCILIAIARLEENGETPVRSSQIYDHYEYIAESRGINPLSTVRSTRKHLNELTMQSFVEQYKQNNGLSGGRYFDYKLGMKAEHVFNILDTE